MATTQIAAQMYTIRDFCKTPADIAKSCEKLAKIGYQAVQASALGPIEATDLRKILDDNGMRCIATHQSVDQLRDTQKAVDYHKTLDCPFTAIGGFGWNDDGEDGWRAFIKDFNTIGPKLAEHGLQVGYHNHSHEFAPFGGAKLNPNNPIKLLLKELDPSITMELDTYWVAHGGGDPAAWIRQWAGRIPTVHVKDMTVTPKREHLMCEVGSGNLNWPAILDACRDAGTQWYIVERDSGTLDPFESLKVSLENLKTMGLS